MNQLSRRIFIAELVVIAAPLSLLLLYALGVFLLGAFSHPRAMSTAIGLVAFLGACSLFSGWALAFRYLRGGTQALSRSASAWWALSGLGAALLLAAFITDHLPPPVTYSALWEFRQYFSLFSIGLPLLIPLAHLVAERLSANGR